MWERHRAPGWPGECAHPCRAPGTASPGLPPAAHSLVLPDSVSWLGALHLLLQLKWVTTTAPCEVTAEDCWRGRVYKVNQRCVIQHRSAWQLPHRFREASHAAASACSPLSDSIVATSLLPSVSSCTLSLAILCVSGTERACAARVLHSQHNLAQTKFKSGLRPSPCCI